MLWSGLKPNEKLQVFAEMQEQGAWVMFVGDDINDALALAIADTGIAMGAKGTEVALETANIAFGLVFNLVAVLASGGGLLTPIMGAVVHNVGSVLVVLSSASIGFFREGSQ